jgi:2Fe-2S ferredoxin
MPQVTYVSFDGETKQTVEINAGMTLMEGAKMHGIAGIDAECGGACACSTCHIYVDAAWLDRVPTVQPIESDMLEFAFEAKNNSRLACQVTVTDDLDGLLVHIPERQI